MLSQAYTPSEHPIFLGDRRDTYMPPVLVPASHYHASQHLFQAQGLGRFPDAVFLPMQ